MTTTTKQIPSTPGPWELWKHDNYIGVKAGDVTIVDAYTVSTNEGRATLALIAATPELAASLRELYDVAMAFKNYGYDAESTKALERAAELLERVGY